MSHTVEVVQYKKLSNGQVSVCLRCCGNEGTDHWHTMAVAVAADPTSRASSLASIREYVAKQHDDAQKAAEGAMDELGNVTQHP